MADLLMAFKTTAGNVFRKKVDSAGREYYVKDGAGRVSTKAFAGANRSMEHLVFDENGNLPDAIRNANSASRLEDITGIPFTEDFTSPVNVTDKNSVFDAERNRFLGFWDSNPDLSRTDAAKEYLRFRNEVADLPTAQRQVIKQKYNLGGS